MRIHKRETPRTGPSEMVIYRFPAKLKKILWRPSKCVLSSTQSAHYFNTERRYKAERAMPSRCLNHCIVFPLNYEKGSRRLSTRISFGLWLKFMKGERHFSLSCLIKYTKWMPAINLKLWRQPSPKPRLTKGLRFLTPPWAFFSLAPCSLGLSGVRSLQPFRKSINFPKCKPSYSLGNVLI